MLLGVGNFLNLSRFVPLVIDLFRKMKGKALFFCLNSGKNDMKKIVQSLSLVLLFAGLCSFQQLRATHAMGMDIYYECMGGNTFRFTLNFYRDCDGVSAPFNATLTARSVSAACNQVSIPLARISGPVEVSPLCAAQLGNSSCVNANNVLPGVQRFIYQGTVTFVQQCADWHIYYDLCCRNGAITNLQNPGAQSQYIFCTMNNTGGLCNNSPQFTSLPTPFICAGQPYNYNHGVFDPDGDSLVYSWTPALRGGYPGTPIPYQAPRLFTDPFNGPESLDSTNGSMYVLPLAATGQFCVVDIKVQEYRNGVLISTTMRDMQIVVLSSCANTQPNLVPMGLTGLSGSGVQLDSNSVIVCPGGLVQFSITATDPNGDNITMTSNTPLVMPGASFTTTGTTTVVGTFSWTPTFADTGFHSFTVTISDDGCPILGAQVFSFDIFVVRDISAGPDRVYCPANGPVQFSVPGGGTLLWEYLPGNQNPMLFGLSCNNCPNPTAAPVGAPGQQFRYRVSSIPANICNLDDTVIVTVAPNFTLNAGRDTTICRNGAVFLQGSGTPSVVGGPITPLWSPAITLSNPNIFNPAASPLNTTNYILVGTDSLGCTMRDTVRVTLSGNGVFVGANANPTTICAPVTSQLSVSISRPCMAVDSLLNPCTGPKINGIIRGTTAAAPNNLLLTPGGPLFGGYGATRVQMVYTPSELNALGLAGGGRIDKVYFRADTTLAPVIGTQVARKVYIKVGCTQTVGYTGFGQLTLPYHPDSLLTTVAFIDSIPPPIAGQWLPLAFNLQSYNWDGQSNLIVNICTDSVSAGTATRYCTHFTNPDTMMMRNQQYPALAPSANPTVCSSTNGVLALSAGVPLRYNTRFEFCASNPSGLIYNWIPATGLSNANIPNPVASPSSTTTYLVNVTDGICTSGSFITVNVNCFLPVEQLNFRGYKISEGVQLEWETLNEFNTERFIVQKSLNSINWTDIGAINAKGFFEGQSLYNHVDPNPVVGSNFYRLIQKDIDGKTVNSNIIEVRYSLESSLGSIYPNPSEPETGFFLNYYSIEKGNLSVTLFDVNGRVITQKEYNVNPGASNLEFPTKEVNAGIYFMKVSLGNSSEVRKVVLAK